MNVSRPNFLDSPYFVMEKGNWHLKPGAPEEVVAEFNAYMHLHEKTKNGRVDVIKDLENE